MTARPAGELYAFWQAARARGLNNRAAALEAGVAEAVLVASGCGREVIRLGGDFGDMLRKLPALARIKSVVRNDCAVQERSGKVLAVNGDAESLQIQADVFVLSARLNAWTRAFAATEPGKAGIKRSLQFFTEAGTSAAKFFLTSESDEAAYSALVERFAANEQGQEEIDIAAATHSTPWTIQLQPAALAGFLYEAARLALPVEITVANDVASQRTVKSLERIKRSARGGWINVLDPGLDLHLHEDRIGNVQVSRTGEGARLRWIDDEGRVALTTRVDSHGDELAAAGVGC